jgi:hypothetical protein
MAGPEAEGTTTMASHPVTTPATQAAATTQATATTPATATTQTAVCTTTRAQRVTKSLLGYGPLAGIVFEGSILIQGLTRHGFSLTRDDASLLANGPLGWIQVTTFLLAGAMTIAAAVGLSRAAAAAVAATATKTATKAGRWAARLIAVYGAGLMAAGVFRADPADGFGPGAPLGKAVHVSWHGDGHLVAASIGFIALIAACFAVARSFSRAGQRGLAIYSRVTGIAFLAAFAGVTTGSNSPAIVVPFYAAVLAVFAWIAVISVHHYRNV